MGTKSGKRGRDGILSTAIDPLLFEGGRTVREIALLLEAQVVSPKGGKFALATIINNIRSRMFVLTERGFKLEKGDKRQVRFIQPVASEATSL